MEAQPGQRWFHRNPKTAVFIIVVVLTLFLDFTLTGIYHVIKYGSIHKHVHGSTVGERSPVFHHSLRPRVDFSYQKWGHISHTVSTNSLGFRDKTVRTIPLSSDNYRLLFMGDSFTQGVGVGYENTFVGLIDTALAKDDVEVLNAGVVSYSPAIYLIKTEHLLSDVGLRFDEVVVFLDISDIQDEALEYDIRGGQVISIGKRPSVIREFLLTYSALLGNLVRAGDQLYEKFEDDPDKDRSEENKRYAINSHRSLWTIDEKTFSQYGELGLQKAREHMTRLHDLLQKRGIHMTLAVYPWPDQIYHDDLDSIQVTFWREWAAERSVHFIDLFPDFVRTGRDPKEVIEAFFIPGDCHWNEAGHQVIAAGFLRAWEKSSPGTPRRTSTMAQSTS